MSTSNKSRRECHAALQFSVSRAKVVAIWNASLMLAKALNVTHQGPLTSICSNGKLQSFKTQRHKSR